MNSTLVEVGNVIDRETLFHFIIVAAVLWDQANYSDTKKHIYEIEVEYIFLISKHNDKQFFFYFIRLLECRWVNSSEYYGPPVRKSFFVICNEFADHCQIKMFNNYN